VLPNPLAGFLRLTSKGREGRKDRRGAGEGKGGKRRRRELLNVPPVPNLPLHHR